MTLDPTTTSVSSEKNHTIILKEGTIDLKWIKFLGPGGGTGGGGL